MKAHELETELGCSINDIQRTARACQFTVAGPGTELSAKQAKLIRDHGIVTVADANTRRAVVVEASPVVPDFDMSAARRSATRPAPGRPRGIGVVDLVLHEDVYEWLFDPAAQDAARRRRAQLILRQFLARGYPNNVKPVAGPGHGWRRTRLGGNGGHQFYLWWAPAGAPPVEGTSLARGQILIRRVRHHDETDQALDADEPRWIGIGARELDADPDSPTFPLGAEQSKVARSSGSARIVRGHPGAGKTTALHLATTYCSSGRAIYLTYSERLAVDARKELAAFGPSDVDIDVLTFRNFLDAFGPSDGTDLSSAGAIAVVAERLIASREKRTGWEGHATELYAELHAHQVGRALPIAFRGAAASATAALDVDVYVALREPVVGAAARPAASLLSEQDLAQVFAAPTRAFHAARALIDGAAVPSRFKGVAWILVDEVQDLTLVEQLLVLETARAIGRSEGMVPGLVVAGDEGQTVRPTDFDWGELADLITDRLAVNPEKHELHGNVRSPRNVATIVNRSWELYGKLQKSERPRGYAQAQIDETTVGRVIQCCATSTTPLNAILTAYGAAPNVAIVYPGSDVPQKFIREGVHIWTAETVKGLDFQTVVVLDAGRRLVDLDDLATAGEPVRTLWARTLADQMRVALSRPTDTLILLDTTDDPDVREEIDRLSRLPDMVDHPDGHVDGWFPDMEPDDLVALLAREEIDAPTMVTLYLDDVRKLLYEDPQRAHTKAAQACGCLGRPTTPGGVRDPSLRKEAWRMRAVTAALIALTSKDRPTAHGMLGKANRYFREAEHPVAAAAMLSLRRAVDDHADAAKDMIVLADELQPLFREVPEAEAAIVATMVAWCGRASTGALPATPQGRERLNEALTVVGNLLSAHHPELLRFREAVRLRIAKRFIGENSCTNALMYLLQLDERQPALEARCYEALEQYDLAADRWEAAQDRVGALRCVREIPDVPRAIALATDVDPPLAARLEWLSELAAASRRGAEGPTIALTRAEYEWVETALAKGLGWKDGLRLALPSAVGAPMAVKRR